MTVKLRHLLTISSIALACALSVPPLLAQSTDDTPAAQSSEPDAPAEGQPGEAQEQAQQPAPAEAPAAAEQQVAAIPPAENDVEKAAVAVLEKHCARCHQAGKLEGRLKPAKGFGNVLDLKALAREPSMIIPGNPDGSSLVKQILDGNMPYDIQDGSNPLAPIPTPDEIATLRSWIAALKPTGLAACEARDFLANDEMVQVIADDLENEPDHRVKGMRYITLTHLLNACGTDEEMEVYRQGVIKLLNSLSTESDPLTLQTVDAGKTIIKFNLDDLNWTEADWDRIIKAYPYATRPDVARYDDVTRRVGTNIPYVRGDWFAFAASRPPLYFELLKMPNTLAELEKGVGLSIEDNVSKFLAKRAGFQRSLVSQNNRLIERHSISTGYFWTSYDFAGNKGNQSLFEHPLGPKGDNAFKHDGGETIYQLPNGLNAYYLNKADGGRLDKGPTEIVRDQDRKDFAVTNGISCFGCHDQGIRLAKDDIRGHVVENRNFSKETREAVAALYPTHEEMDGILKEDMERFQNAMRRAGLDPALKLDGIEPINALSNRYEKDVHLQLAAAEFGLKVDELEAAATDRGGDARTLLRRLQQSVVPRDNFEALFTKLVSELTDDQPATSSEAVAQSDVAKPNQGDSKVEGKSELTLLSDKSEYKIGEKPVFIVQSSSDCNLTLVNVDAKGVGTVLFPNKFQQDNAIKANQAIEFPAPDAPFQFRMKDPGTETVIALCNAKSKTVDLIEHKFDTKAFTNLGDYEKFVTDKAAENLRAIAVEAAEKKAEKAAEGEKKEAAAAEGEKKEEAKLAEAAGDKIATRSGVNRAAIKVSVQ